MTNDDDDYKVGYCNPPRHTRFKKGQSGNPKGRPKVSKSLDFKTLIKKSLSKRVKVRVDGDVKYFSKIEAGLEQIANKAASGDIRAIKILLPLMEDIDQQENAQKSYVGTDLSDAKEQLRVMLGLPPKE